jgi:hypothetical protein
MIERDYVMRMINILVAMIARILMYKQKKDFPAALREIEATGRTLLGVDRNLVSQFSPAQLMDLFGADLTVAVPKAYALAILLKEEADVVRQMGDQAESDRLNLRSLSLFLDTLFKGEIPVEPRHLELIGQVLESLRGCTLPADMLVKVFRFHERMGNYDRAENTLFEILEVQPEFREEGLWFYRRLMEKPDAELEAGNLPRSEVVESMREIEGERQPGTS